MLRAYTARESGFTIIEILVAVTLSLILLAGVSQIYLGSRTTYKLQTASGNVQENGRFSMEFMAKDIRMAGYMGCAKANVKLTNNIDPTGKNTTNDVSNTLATFDGSQAVQGYTYDGVTVPVELQAMGFTAADLIAGTDIIQMNSAQSCAGGDIVCHNNTDTGVTKTCKDGSGMGSAEYKIADNSSCQIKQNDVVLISDCVTADIHGVTNNPSGDIHDTIAHGSNLNYTPKLFSSYGEGSSVYKMHTDIYYLDIGASGEPALFRAHLDQGTLNKQELVDGVYNMVLTYGVDTTGDSVPNRYVAAADVADWTQIVNVSVALSTRSRDDNVTESSSTYTYNGAAVTDKRLRRDFSTTVTIRNRVK